MQLITRVSLAFLLTVAACGGVDEPASSTLAADPRANAAHGGGGGTQVPPPPSVDGPAWFINNASAVIGTLPTPEVDFGALQNTVQGAIRIGDSRSAQVLVYNISKKTSLTLTEIAVTGANASDFAVAPASIQAALGVPIPANRGAAVVLQVTFTPSAEGARTAALRLVSNAGTALVSLAGAGLPARPILVATGSISFLPGAAPATAVVTNEGGPALVLQSIALGGINPASFAFTVANHGFSNCFAGIPLPPHGSCFLGIGVVEGAPLPSSAVVAIQSNDPVHPETDIQLTLTP